MFSKQLIDYTGEHGLFSFLVPLLISIKHHPNLLTIRKHIPVLQDRDSHRHNGERDHTPVNRCGYKRKGEGGDSLWVGRLGWSTQLRHEASLTITE